MNHLLKWIVLIEYTFMARYAGFLTILLFSPLYSPLSSPAVNEIMLTELPSYFSIDFGSFEKPDLELFQKGLNGFNKLNGLNKLSDKQIITLIDFRKSGNEKRLWVIDLKNKKVLYHSLVAHGRNSGEVYASRFSNTPNSNQSSLGFFVTGNTYIGKHGTSLKLIGMEKGINDKAEERAIVIHGADYVSNSYINKVGRIGRSFGCPAIPMNNHEEIINTIANGTCLFIYYPDEVYLSNSNLNKAP